MKKLTLKLLGMMTKKNESCKTHGSFLFSRVQNMVNNERSEFFMTYLEKVKLCNSIKLHRQKWGVRRYQNDDGTLTEEAKNRYMAKETVAMINSNVEKQANEYEANGLLHEQKELKDWQWEIILENESKDEGC